MNPLDFERERDQATGSWERACSEPVLVERIAWDQWLVTFRDSEDTHRVRLHRDHGAYLSDCWMHPDRDDCPGFAYHDGTTTKISTSRFPPETNSIAPLEAIRRRTKSAKRRNEKPSPVPES